MNEEVTPTQVSSRAKPTHGSEVTYHVGDLLAVSVIAVVVSGWAAVAGEARIPVR